MNKRTESNLQNVFLVFVFIFLLVISIIIAFKYGETKASNNSDQICVPKIAGVYTPIDGSNKGIVVLDLKDNTQNKLFSEIQRAWLSITNGGLG